MLSENQRKKIDTILQEEINKSIMHDKIRKVVSEEVYRYINNLVTESDDISIKRKSVMNMLKDGKYNHAELMRHIYHPRDKGEEDTYRSLFSKKATGKPDNDGSVRHFTDEEITKLYELLRSR